MEIVKEYLMKSVYRRFVIFLSASLIILVLLVFFNTPVVSFILSTSALYASAKLIQFLLNYFLGEVK